MKDKIIQLDGILAKVTVNGENLMLIAQARSLLVDIFKDVERSEGDGKREEN